MKKEELAQLLNGRQRRDEMTNEEHLQAEKDGLLVCFGASDDLLEFRGLIYDETSGYEGATCHLFKNRYNKLSFIGDIDYHTVLDDLNEYGLSITNKLIQIDALWCPEELECSWLLTTDIPHATAMLVIT